MIRQGWLALLLLGACTASRPLLPSAPAARIARISANRPAPPVAERAPRILEIHGDRRVDDYFWLRERDNPKVIAHLGAENRYTEAMTESTTSLRRILFEEIRGRIQETDSTVPYQKGAHLYYSRTEAGKSYSILCRRKNVPGASEEVLLDENALAAGSKFLYVPDAEVSPNAMVLAYSADKVGDEHYRISFEDLATKTIRDADTIQDVGAGLAWADDQTLFYASLDHANRPYKLMRHRLGTPQSKDVLVHQENDEAFFVSVVRARSGRYVILKLESETTSEVRFLDVKSPNGAFKVIEPRRPGIEYGVAQVADHFFIRTNEGALNFRVMEAPVGAPGRSSWREVIAHRPEVMITGLGVVRDHLIVLEQEGGLPQIRIRKLSTSSEHRLSFREPAYALHPGDNAEHDTASLRFVYESLVTPSSVFDYDLDARTSVLRKEKPIHGYDRTRYLTERIFATAVDGARIPISIVHPRGIEKDGQNPLFLTGYGAYGVSYDPTFNPSWLSLLDRGFVVAIAHVRGGGEMGRAWYEGGKLLKKKNTFGDFIAAAETLIAQGYTSKERLAISGVSAGGLLIGAVTNQRPDLFRAVVADVPFVDVLNTMLDPTLPLTVIEYEEWGNPNQEEAYRSMRSYSPYDNVERKAYPSMLVLGGLNDRRVSYWEPAKWVAKLRAMKTDPNPLLLRTHMGAGHGGASGRYEKMEEEAFQFAFILEQLQVR